MLDDGLLKVKNSETSIEELEKLVCINEKI
jgi:hypothetical protein